MYISTMYYTKFYITVTVILIGNRHIDNIIRYIDNFIDNINTY